MKKSPAHTGHKIVIYGPAGAGKTKMIETIDRHVPDGRKSRLIRLTTDGDRLKRFEAITITMENIPLRLFTTPGGLFLNSARKKILRGAHGVLFVGSTFSDSGITNRDSLEQLSQNIAGLGVTRVPIVIFWNIFDAHGLDEMKRLRHLVERWNVSQYHGSVKKGSEVFLTLKSLCDEIDNAFPVDPDRDKTVVDLKPAVEGRKNRIQGIKYHGRPDHYQGFSEE